jgi:hypothetical protein
MTVSIARLTGSSETEINYGEGLKKRIVKVFNTANIYEIMS